MTKRYQITAIIYDKRGRVMSVGKNSYVKTHPLQAAHAKRAGEPHRVFLHAEIHAISLCRDLTKAHSMKIFRFLEDGSPALARPCVVCESAIRSSGIQIVDHT
jgi:tRNA(Arg) A34 adenosine deaminase TadA